MSGDRAPWWLRPVHVWFFWWEDLVPSLYRVLAVAVAAGVSTLVLAGLGVPAWGAAPVTLAVWIALAVKQEHDERIVLPVDPIFLGALRESVDPLLAARGYAFDRATGPRRARPDRDDVVVYVTPERREDWSYVRFVRSPVEGSMSAEVDGRNLAALVARSGDAELAERVGQALDPESDAAALGTAVVTLPEETWP